MESPVPAHVTETIESVAWLRANRHFHRNPHHRLIEAITSRFGRPATVYLLVLLIVGWTSANAAAAKWLGRSIDPPPFFWLQGLVTAYAAIMTTVVLTKQNRESRNEERHAELGLEINLLAEQKLAKIISLLEEMRRDLPIANRIDPVAEDMQTAVNPAAIMLALQETLDAEEDLSAAGLPSPGAPSAVGDQTAEGVTHPGNETTIPPKG